MLQESFHSKANPNSKAKKIFLPESWNALWRSTISENSKDGDQKLLTKITWIRGRLVIS